MNVYTVTVTEKLQPGKRKAYQARLIVHARTADLAEGLALKASRIDPDQVAALTSEEETAAVIWTFTNLVVPRS